jgi:transcription initiation factor IIF auxiliary subunit
MSGMKIKIWVIKWALTKGIFTVDATEMKRADNEPAFMQVAKPDGSTYYLEGEGKEFARFEFDACVFASKMADKEIERMKKKIKEIKDKQAGFRVRTNQILKDIDINK